MRSGETEMKSPLRPFFHQCLVSLAILLPCSLLAQEEKGIDGGDGTIEIVYPSEYTEEYKERRSDWSTVFSVTMDNILPDKYRSKIQGETFEDLFGKTNISIVQVEIGTKYNFSLGALGASLFYGVGEIDDDRIGEKRKLSLSKQGIGFNFTMDNLFDEPLVAPYVGGQVFTMNYKETAPDVSDSGQTAMTTGYTVGLLLQLNWLDPNSALQAQNSSGLENSYLDLFLSQYNTSESEDDPNFQTSFNWGAGLRLEF